MAPKIILLNQDGPMANFEKGFLDQWQKRFPGEPFVPLGKRTTHKHKGQYPEDKTGEICCAPGFFRRLEPVPGFKEAIQKLTDRGHDVRICTSPISAYANCVLEKYEWVDEHLGGKWTDKIILTKDKTIIAGNILIDDNPEIEGLMIPMWHRVVFDMPFNRHVSSVYPRITNWKNWERVMAPILGE